MARLTDYRVLTFDCYGTLIDWEAGIWAALQSLIRSNGAIGLTRDEALRAFARFEGQHERASPDLAYPDLLARVHRDLAASFGLRTDRELDADFGNSVPRWPAFPDSAAALGVLKRHFRLVILSNVHRNGSSPPPPAGSASSSTPSTPPRTSAPTSRRTRTSSTWSTT